jgi:hypothetical protein
VTYAEFTDQDRLRFPIFESLRPDAGPAAYTFAALSGDGSLQALDTPV